MPTDNNIWSYIIEPKNNEHDKAFEEEEIHLGEQKIQNLQIGTIGTTNEYTSKHLLLALEW